MLFIKNIIRKWKLFFEKILTFLGVGTVPCGLEITDHVLRLAYFNKGSWKVVAVRLEPGILEKGKIKDRPRFVEYLAVLKANVPGAEGKKKKIDVTVALGEAAIYNKVFSLPYVEGKNLQNAIALNMQMASPTEVSEGYSGWQIAGRDEKSSKIDVLGTFADRSTVDDMSLALFEAGFVSLIVESKALATVRMFRDQASNINPNASYITLSIDDASLDFLIVRGGQLYFEYANSWSDLADEKGSITIEKFRETLATSLRQVSNFYLQHWDDKIAGIVIATMIFRAEVEEVAQEVLGLPVIGLVSAADSTISPEWFPVIGAGLRSMDPTGDGINLLGEGAAKTFENDRILRFAAFWRFLIPVASILLVSLFVVADFFLISIKNTVRPLMINLSGSMEDQELSTLVASASDFNRSVTLMQAIQTNNGPTYPLIQEIVNAAATSTITVTRVSFIGPNQPCTLTGQAGSQAQILAFETALRAQPRVTSVDLPLSGIQNNGSMYSFSMTITFSSR